MYIKSFLKRLRSTLRTITAWIGAHPLIERALHTVWQACLGYVLAHFTAPHSSQEVQTLLTGTYGAALSALKTYALNLLAGRGA